MNDNLKQMWDSVRDQKLPSHKKFRSLWGENRSEINAELKNHQPDFSSKERKNVGGI